MIIACSGLVWAKNLWLTTKCGHVTNKTKGSGELQQALALKNYDTEHFKTRFVFPQIWSSQEGGDCLCL